VLTISSYIPGDGKEKEQGGGVPGFPGRRLILMGKLISPMSVP